MHLISMFDVSELLRSTNREYNIARGSPDGSVQLALFRGKQGEVILRFETTMPILWAIHKEN
jgi:hypothetical protein